MKSGAFKPEPYLGSDGAKSNTRTPPAPCAKFATSHSAPSTTPSPRLRRAKQATRLRQWILDDTSLWLASAGETSTDIQRSQVRIGERLPDPPEYAV